MKTKIYYIHLTINSKIKNKKHTQRVISNYNPKKNFEIAIEQIR